MSLYDACISSFVLVLRNLTTFGVFIRTRCLSVVAILTLEVTGIPALSDDRTFPWPKASFVGLQTRGPVFEVR